MNFNITENQNVSDLAKYKENIINFQAFLRKAIPILEIQKKQLKKMAADKELQNTTYQGILTGLIRYEDNNIEYMSDSDVSRRMLTNPSTGSDFTERFGTQWKTLKNPYKDAYFWIKGELLDLKGLKQAIEGREVVVKQWMSAESKKRSDQTELEKLNQGKTTLKSLFKSKNAKDTEIITLQGVIENTNRDIEEYKKLVNFLTIYHGEVAIQKFKQEKSRGYLRVLLQVASKEISNSCLAATLWNEVLGMVMAVPQVK